MGLQQVQDVALIRHAYVLSSHQKRGIGAHLLSHLRELAGGAVLIGTWADAVWAIRFYERHGFQLVDSEEKDRLAQKVLDRARAPKADVRSSGRSQVAGTPIHGRLAHGNS